MSKFWCFFGVHEYTGWRKIQVTNKFFKKAGDIETFPNGQIVTLVAACKVCGKATTKRIES